MPPSTQTTERLLGQISAEIKALNERLDRSDDHRESERLRDLAEIQSMKKDIEELKTYMIRVEGGKKMFFVLLGVAATIGGFLWEVFSRFFPFAKAP
jgi:hypothetical protein